MLTTYAHALKSASANIGAEGISYTASELEFAGRNGDTVYIDKNIKTFTDELSIILANIKGYLASTEKKPAGHEKAADLVVLKKAVSRIGEGLENVDIEAIEEVLAELRAYKWDESTALLLGKMKDYAGFFDYDGIESVLEELRALCS